MKLFITQPKHRNSSSSSRMTTFLSPSGLLFFICLRNVVTHSMFNLNLRSVSGDKKSIFFLLLFQGIISMECGMCRLKSCNVKLIRSQKLSHRLPRQLYNNFVTPFSSFISFPSNLKHQ